MVVPSKAQTQAFIDKGVYIEPNSRCCNECSYLTSDALQLLSHIKTSNNFSKSDITFSIVKKSYEKYKQTQI